MRVLLVEDNPGDVDLVAEGLEESPLPVELAVARDGVEALSWLGLRRGAEPPEIPSLIILDLNLPRRNGWQVLEEIRRDSEFFRVPVVVLTSSDAAEDIDACYDRGANCYLTKPIDLKMYMSVVRHIEAFWLHLVALPGVGGGRPRREG
ncbi:response regulator [Mangrovihabitans endophyticus]|uniref:Response regulator n=1 Tax=Mangrovihabitans endophyticus TaxID=1751298 RepID=A0A8J3C1T7_9ACTN|nr:response regulator [Mangrovihabitans endophyticus]GGL06913.1 response regulator [Mangrovihabitans endophyticus]